MIATKPKMSWGQLSCSGGWLLWGSSSGRGWPEGGRQREEGGEGNKDRDGVERGIGRWRGGGRERGEETGRSREVSLSLCTATSQLALSTSFTPQPAQLMV